MVKSIFSLLIISCKSIMQIFGHILRIDRVSAIDKALYKLSLIPRYANLAS